MLVKEEDLPMQVVVYYWGSKYHVDSLVNPPYKTLLFRKFVKYASRIIFVTSLLLALITISFKINEFIAGALLMVSIVSYFCMIIETKSTP